MAINSGGRERYGTVAPSGCDPLFGAFLSSDRQREPTRPNSRENGAPFYEVEEQLVADQA